MEFAGKMQADLGGTDWRERYFPGSGVKRNHSKPGGGDMENLLWLGGDGQRGLQVGNQNRQRLTKKF